MTKRLSLKQKIRLLLELVFGIPKIPEYKPRPKTVPRRTQQKTYKCEQCGQEIDEIEYESNHGYCDTCYEEEEFFPVWEV